MEPITAKTNANNALIFVVNVQHPTTVKPASTDITNLPEPAEPNAQLEPIQTSLNANHVPPHARLVLEMPKPAQHVRMDISCMEIPAVLTVLKDTTSQEIHVSHVIQHATTVTKAQQTVFLVLLANIWLMENAKISALMFSSMENVRTTVPQDLS